MKKNHMSDRIVMMMTRGLLGLFSKIYHIECCPLSWGHCVFQHFSDICYTDNVAATTLKCETAVWRGWWGSVRLLRCFWWGFVCPQTAQSVNDWGKVEGNGIAETVVPDCDGQYGITH